MYFNMDIQMLLQIKSFGRLAGMQRCCWDQLLSDATVSQTAANLRASEWRFRYWLCSVLGWFAELGYVLAYGKYCDWCPRSGSCFSWVTAGSPLALCSSKHLFICCCGTCCLLYLNSNGLSVKHFLYFFLFSFSLHQNAAILTACRERCQRS